MPIRVIGKFANDRRLSQEERDTLLAWIDHGCPKGEDKDLPPPRDFVAGWTDRQAGCGSLHGRGVRSARHGPAHGIPYKYFTVETHFTEDKWVERAQAVAGNRSVVHHIVVFIVPPGQRFSPEKADRCWPARLPETCR